MKRVSAEEREMHAQQVNALKEERRKVEEEFRADAESNEVALEVLWKKICKGEDGIVQTTKEILSVGHE